ncbi:protein-tyrosine phosphatase-like protein [Aspergillus falconensis]
MSASRRSALCHALLSQHRISHVLCIMRWEDLQHGASSGPVTATATATSVQPGPEPKNQIRRKQVELDDDPTEDLLGCLNSMLNWIHDALVRPHPHSAPNPQVMTLNTHTGGRVLVHCERGISRSGAVVVAYIMRTLGLPYRTALSIAQLSRPQISPNIGFEWQLRMWEGCGYDVFDRVLTGDQGQIMIKRKAGYEQWADVIDKIYDRADAVEMARAKEDYLRNLAEMLGVLR